MTAHTKEDWIAIKRETDAVIQAFIDASRAGEPATGSVAMAVAEDHRRQITRWFYDCGHDQHRHLAEGVS